MLTIKQKIMSLGIAVFGIIFFSLVVSSCTGTRPNLNTEQIRTGDCVRHVANPEAIGVVLRTSNSTATVRRENAQDRSFWHYPEITRIECPRGN